MCGTCFEIFFYENLLNLKSQGIRKKWKKGTKKKEENIFKKQNVDENNNKKKTKKKNLCTYAYSTFL